MAGTTPEVEIYMDATNDDLDFWFAKPGTYTAEFIYRTDANPSKDEKVSSKFEVENGLQKTNPSVTVSSKVVDSISSNQAIISEGITTMVDVNNNVSQHESIVGLYGMAWDDNTIVDEYDNPRTSAYYIGEVDHDFKTFNQLNQNNDKVYVKYACVKDNVAMFPFENGITGKKEYAKVSIKYMVPINTSFKAE